MRTLSRNSDRIEKSRYTSHVEEDCMRTREGMYTLIAEVL